ncbi:amino acid adenylation domain-containing protein/thioester reductase-like protein [Chryseobacterium rhizosphaerae]|uniref:non-ribosomal peptide synthetase n=1 Tax=Chryseobacterium rhizosphaerae TaxID=395937 RepID=UPI002864AA4A|nr:amino acid adenylation domain-containing protein [Chryseobacterium rhizosphaerae]MDR6547788.1 amino acid adenylation domain-containing protein/thioester reductase-like protein [Chryseobacterium rhizosphaerae]
MNLNALPDPKMIKGQLIQDEQLKQILEFNHTSNDTYPLHKTIIDLIEEQVKMVPDKTAIIYQNKELTYREMDEMANQLANHMMRIVSIQPDDRIGLMIDRSEKLIISLLAIMKTGAAYVPMPPLYPEDRLKNISSESKISLLLTENAFEKTAKEVAEKSLCWENVYWETMSAEKPERTLKPHHLMYVMFTSGSTGGPKGVAVEHINVVNALSYFIEKVIPGSAGHMLAVSTYAFDISVLEIFSILMTGNTLVVASQEDQLNPEAIVELLLKYKITVAQTTPSTWSMLADTINWEKIEPMMIICGGEYLSPALGKTLLKGKHTICNVYGPTETTIWVTSKIIKSEEDLMTIGGPIANTDIYIMENDQILPIHETGEICVGGINLSRGYFGHQELTDSKFIDHPLKKGEKIYKTGDLGKWVPNGEIEYAGRIDDQVKIRGYRIELQEIEESISKLEGVGKAVVKVKPESDYDKKLIGFLEYPGMPLDDKNKNLLIKNFREQLKQTLPVYMIPHDFVIMEKLPINSNGKIDKKALLDNYKKAFVSVDEKKEFRNNYEKTIFGIWTEILQYPFIEVTDNFFELGGHSLLLAKLYNRLPDSYRDRISLQDLFIHKTIESQANIIENRTMQNISHQDDAQNESMIKQLLEDAQLVPEISVTDGDIDASVMNSPQNVLLTGANGFVGVHIIDELMKQTETTVYCLIRGENEQIALKRLHQAFEQFLLPTHWLTTGRIKVVTGDLNNPLLGLGEEQFNYLAKTIDCIYHSGSSVNFIEPYSIIRKANILGLQEVIKFAAAEKIKPVSLFSTSAVFSFGHQFTHKKWVYENDDIHQDLQAVSRDLGYVQSKWVMEQIMQKAEEKGVPVIVFRLGYALSNSQTGSTAVYQWWGALVKSCIANKAYPTILGFKSQLVPVDYMAKSIVHISRQKNALGKKFHLTPLAERDVSITDFFDRINQYFGFDMKPLPYNEWLDTWKNNEEDPLYPLLGMFTDKVYGKATLKEVYKNTYYYDAENTLDFIKDSDMPYPPLINKDILEPYLKYLAVL